MVENVLDKLIDLFSKGQAQFRVLQHEAAGKSSRSVAEIRGTELGQGAKALVCHLKGNGVKLYVLAILPADKQADLAKLRCPPRFPGKPRRSQRAHRMRFRCRTARELSS